MDLSALKDMDVKDLLSKLKDSQAIFSDKKMLTKFGIIFGAIVIFLIIYYFYFNPMFQKQKEQIEEMKHNETETNRMIEEEANLEAEIKNLEPEFNENTSLFHTNAEFENFMMTMDDIAKKYGLSVDDIHRKERVPVYDPNTDGQNTDGQNSGTPLYFTLPVTWKISGTYLGYLKYRREISATKKHIHFHKETIVAQENARPGEISAEGTISIVQLPN
jgi:Tfp pilus assembly protein PilO